MKTQKYNITGAAKGVNDLQYSRNNTKTGMHLENTIHVFTPDSLRTELETAGFILEGNVRPAKIWGESSLVRSKTLSTIDRFLSKHLPQFLPYPRCIL